MASGGRIKGITIQLDGEATPLQRTLSDVDRSLTETSRKLKDVNKLLKLDPTSTELLSQKQKTLKTAIEQTKDRLQKLKDAQKGVKEGTDEWDKLQREIIATEEDLKDLEKQYRDFGSVTSQKLKVVGDKMKELGDKVADVGKKMTTSLTVPIVGAFTAAGKSASDYEENLNKIDTAFGESADSVKAWAATATEQYGLSMVAATEAASGFGALAKGIGLGEESAAEMSTSLAGLSSDLSSYFNVSSKDAATALQGIFTGEAEALKKFGVVMNDTNLEKFAADQGLVWKEASQAEKTMIRYQFVMEKTKDAQGDYSKTSDGTANSIRTLMATLQNLATTIGQELLPIITPVVQKITEVVKKFTELDPHTKELIVKIGLITAALGPVLTVGGTLISAIGTIITTVGTLSGALAAAGGASAVFGGAIAAITSPIGIAIAAIAAIIAFGVLLYKNWDTVCEWAKKLKDTVINAWTALKTGVVNAVNNVKTAVSNAWNNIKNAVVNTTENMKTMLKGKLDNIKAAYEEHGGGIKGIASAAVEAIKEYWTLGFDAINTLTGGKLDAIKEKFTSAFNAVKDTVKNAIDAVKGWFSGLKLELPHIKLPHFKLSGSFSLSPPSVPSISVDWYKKAYDQPWLFTSPTIVGNRGFGDGGGSGEMVYGRDQLLRDISVASGRDQLANDIYEAMSAALDHMDTTIVIGNREFGRILREQGAIA